jgi:hypothetical protein
MGEQQLWITRDDDDNIVAALTTQIVNYPSRTLLSVQFLGGHGFDEWSNGMLDLLEAFARDANCSGVEAVGRFGFWPFFKKRGYTKAYCTYECEITEEINDE